MTDAPLLPRAAGACKRRGCKPRPRPPRRVRCAGRSRCPRPCRLQPPHASTSHTSACRSTRMPREAWSGGHAHATDVCMHNLPQTGPPWPQTRTPPHGHRGMSLMENKTKARLHCQRRPIPFRISTFTTFEAMRRSPDDRRTRAASFLSASSEAAEGAKAVAPAHHAAHQCRGNKRKNHSLQLRNTPATVVCS